MKKRICIFLFLLFVFELSFSQEFFTQNQNATLSKTSSKKTYKVNNKESDSFGEILFDLLFELSILNNMMVEFDSYPYAHGPRYVKLFENDYFDNYKGKFYRFNIDAAALYNINDQILNPCVKLDGYVYKFFGPIFEHTNYIDFRNTDFYKGSFKLGLEMAIFQTNFLSLSWDIEWLHYYGNGSLNGLNVGAQLKSYPVKPLVIEYRFNFSTIYDNSNYCDGPYDDNLVFEHYVEVGCMLNCPLELYGCYRFIQDGIMQSQNHSLGIGAKYYF